MSAALPDPSRPLDAPEDAFARILSGQVEDADIARFLIGLAERGEEVAEIVGAARALRANMIAVAAPEGAVDVCGTGGDGQHTFNISTAVAIVVAGAGVPVAKHGNRAASSLSGAADILSCLGLDLELAPERVEASIAEIGIGFLFAAHHHPVMARVAPVRRALKRRTIFNLIGPLANPAGVKRQLVGVFDRDWTAPLAEALLALGSEEALVVHGLDGLDEITVTTTTASSHLKSGAITDREISPQSAGLTTHGLDSLRGGTPEQNAAALLALLDGAPGAYRDIVALNAGAALMVAGRAETLEQGVKISQTVIDDGRASAKLDQWRDFR